MNAVKAPYSINKMTSCLAAEALSSPSLKALQAVVQDTLRERERLGGAARLLILRVHRLPSDANFLLVRLKQHDKAKPLHEAGRERGRGPLSRRPGQFIRVHPRYCRDALRFGCFRCAPRGRAGVWVGPVWPAASQLR